MSCTDKDMGRTRDCNRTFLSAYLRFKLVEGGNPSVFLVRNSGLLQISSFPWSQSLCTTEGYTAYALRQNHLFKVAIMHGKRLPVFAKIMDDDRLGNDCGVRNDRPLYC
ncbi:hypothetical protein OUZ56_001563 [Daphnia magna]|uniref:Uncharacterized protein n=1 Tax=Daphnia magna TaxID=35525 RepID=A0ABR0A321_9CRUS|nr:hypothetical protein OUZ56_001563 [Daphnia magna]